MPRPRTVDAPEARKDHVVERQVGGTPSPEREAGQPYATEIEDYTHPRAPRTSLDESTKDDERVDRR